MHFKPYFTGIIKTNNQKETKSVPLPCEDVVGGRDVLKTTHISSYSRRVRRMSRMDTTECTTDNLVERNSIICPYMLLSS